MSYPTGVECHGGKLRIWFMYQGVRVRENLGVEDNPKNRRVAGELRSSVCYAIKTGVFNYAERFPQSVNLKRFGHARRDIAFGELCDKWIELKEVEICRNTMQRYISALSVLKEVIGSDCMASRITVEFVMELRRTLLLGTQMLKPHHKVPSEGRSVSTVKNYMTRLNGVLKFAEHSGYIESNPMAKIQPLRMSRVEPDPLTKDEFYRVISACKSRQDANIWSLAVYTGMRHGELCALAWEDIDLVKGTITVRRNFTQVGEYTLPKTESGTNRVINLIDPALTILRDQAELTRLGKKQKVTVVLREYKRKEIHDCTFVFDPSKNMLNGLHGISYCVGALGRKWNQALRRAGVRHRNAYQSRHTFACWFLTAGANPSFIASQMGHANAQMLYQVYGKWMSDNDNEQMELLNRKIGANAPLMPQVKSV